MYFKYFLASNELSRSSSILTLMRGFLASSRFLRSASLNVFKSSGNCNEIEVSIWSSNLGILYRDEPELSVAALDIEC